VGFIGLPCIAVLVSGMVAPMRVSGRVTRGRSLWGAPENRAGPGGRAALPETRSFTSMLETWRSTVVTLRNSDAAISARDSGDG